MIDWISQHTDRHIECTYTLHKGKVEYTPS